MTARSIATLGLATLAATACMKTSLRETQVKAPMLVADSARSVTDISQCVTDAWIERGATPKLINRSNGVSLVWEAANNNAIILALLDLTPTPDGTHAEVRIFKTLFSKQNRGRVDAVRACL